jgi:Bor protein
MPPLRAISEHPIFAASLFLGGLMRKLIPLALALILSACFHAVIETGATPSTVTIERHWAAGWLYGLVPPSTTETQAKCPAGVAKVETQHSFLNMFAAGLAWGIYEPMTIVVTCAERR